MFFSIETGWELSDFFSIRLKPSNGIDINRPYCFNLSGLFMSSNSNIMLNVNGYTCQKLAVAPKFRTECSLDCVVDSNFANAKCEPCRATCIKDQESTAVGTQTCTMNVLKSPNSLGKPCSTISTNVCSITCPVDCKYDGPFWQNCPANCATPTSTRRGYYSIVRPNLNGGKTCNLPLPTESLCSLEGRNLISSCQKNCVVTGIPDVNCLSACSGRFSTAVIEYTYPITVVSPTLNGSPCSCILGTSPTSIGSCEASCSALNGQAATGLKVYHYPIAQTGVNMNSCVTTSYSTCYKSCPCTFTSAKRINSCVLTTTKTTITPWVAEGYLKVSAVGSLPAWYDKKDY
ncbi:hypothetical protein HMI56_002574 [Coelomomyces lativittatus]|nr:hypothetical protein HMI56_002574 [Coelomomyces lativittatus]